MCDDLIIKKIVAKNGERQVFPSDLREMYDFLSEEKYRSDFDDDSTIAVKFSFYGSELEDDEYGDIFWIINPLYSKNGIEYLASEILPEIFLLKDYDIKFLLEQYDSFYNHLMSASKLDLNDEEKLQLFYDYLKE